MILASVQTQADASVPGVLVALAVAALILTVLAVSVPEIVRAWRRASDVIDRAPYPTRIPTPRQETKP